MTLKLIPGTVMSTQEMAEKLKVSRTPVREAFIRLSEESLVDVVPQKETVVSRIDMKRVHQERFIRESLELSVLAPFMERLKPENIQWFQTFIDEQKRFQKEKQYAKFLDSDNQMHRQIFLVAGQELAWDTLQGVNGHDYRFRLLAIQNEETISETVQQHQKIIDLMAKGELLPLYEELTAHLHKVHFEAIELMRDYPGYFKSEDSGTNISIDAL